MLVVDVVVVVVGCGSGPAAIAACRLASKADNDNLAITIDFEETYKVLKKDGTDSNARLYAYTDIATVGTSASTDNHAVGCVLQKAGLTAVILEVDGDDSPTKLGVIAGALSNGDQLQDSVDNTKTCTITLADGANVTNYVTMGLGLDPVYNFDDYDSDGNALDTSKITIDTSNVFLQTDLIYYMDNKQNEDAEKMMTKGLAKNYTQFVNVKTSLSDTTSLTAYAAKDPKTYNRLIGFSNSVLRNLMFAVYNSGTQDKEQFEYHNKPKMNPLLNKYHSRGSLVQNGVRLNVNINSVPFFSSQIETDLRMFRELNKCKGSFFVNKGMYQAWNQCRQLDAGATTQDNTEPSLQPGFTTADSATQPTAQYEINERKAAIAAHGWNGINQKWLRGMCHYNGVSFQVE